MSIATIKTEIKTLLDTVSGVENSYKRRVVYRDQKDFVSKFQSSDKSNILGFQIYRSNLVSNLIAFSNKFDHIHTMTINGIIGIKDSDGIISYNTLQTIFEGALALFSRNLTLNGAVTNADLPGLGMIDFDTYEGIVFWSGDITWVLQEHEIVTGNIS